MAKLTRAHAQHRVARRLVVGHAGEQLEHESTRPDTPERLRDPQLLERWLDDRQAGVRHALPQRVELGHAGDLETQVVEAGLAVGDQDQLVMPLVARHVHHPIDPLYLAQPHHRRQDLALPAPPRPRGIDVQREHQRVSTGARGCSSHSFANFRKT